MSACTIPNKWHGAQPSWHSVELERRHGAMHSVCTRRCRGCSPSRTLYTGPISRHSEHATSSRAGGVGGAELGVARGRDRGRATTRSSSSSITSGRAGGRDSGVAGSGEAGALGPGAGVGSLVRASRARQPSSSAVVVVKVAMRVLFMRRRLASAVPAQRSSIHPKKQQSSGWRPLAAGGGSPAARPITGSPSVALAASLASRAPPRRACARLARRARGP